MKRPRGDNARLRQIDEQLGFVDKDGESPATIAERQGVASHIVGSDHGLPIVVWESKGVCSYTVLNRHRFLTTTLLARTPQGVVRLLDKLNHRVRSEADAQHWSPYYAILWETRYRKWVHKKDGNCDCQLCRIERSRLTPPPSGPK
jgi:hypothetical protein